MRVAIDSGGTFTDCVFVSDGKLELLKVVSTPENPSQAILSALRQVARRLGPRRTGSLELLCGTTVGTNALLERRGGRVALVTTAGFEDVLEIGRQARPRLYDFFVDRPEPLVPRKRRIGIRERLGADGRVVVALSSTESHRMVEAIQKARPDAVAVCLLFSYLDPGHEQRVAKALRAAGYDVSVSHEILPEFREFERTSTVVVNAYLVPVMGRYLRETVKRSGTAWAGRGRSHEHAGAKVRVRIMQSNGGAVSADVAAREPVRTILSGPAGGVLGAEYVASLAGFSRAITFDMGGTSTDVSLLGEGLRTTTEAQVSGLPVAVSMLEIHTVGAGGGSIARFDRGGALRVGPESAGADPGPICYGKGERATVTDAHLVLGHLGSAGLLGGEFPLDAGRTRRYMERARGPLRTVEDFALGILAVANSVMEKAIRVVSVERGHDPRDYVLVAFGGAGALHACELAGALGMRGALVPRLPGGLSAVGILRADVVKDFSQTVNFALTSWREASAQLARSFAKLLRDGMRAMSGEGVPTKRIRVERWLDLRYAGQAYSLSVPARGDFVAAFHRAHDQRHGYHDESRSMEIVNVRCRFIGLTHKPELPRIARAKPSEAPRSAGSIRCGFAGGYRTAALYRREDLKAGHQLRGPAVVTEYSATTVVPPDWTLRVDVFGNLFLTKGNVRG